MKNFVYMLDKRSGRIIMVSGSKTGKGVEFTFLPRFDSLRLARVTIEGVTNDMIPQLCAIASEAIVSLAIYYGCGRQDRTEVEIANLAGALDTIGAVNTEITVEV